MLSAWAQPFPAFSLQGYFFGDYFYKLRGDTSSLPTQYALFARGDNGVQFRRLYFWADARLHPRCSVRFLLEANETSLDANGRYAMFVKEVSVTWDSLALPFLQLQAGLIPTPTWRLSEQLWGYRSLERMLPDIWNWGDAVDVGLAIRGIVTEGSRTILQVTAMVGGGEGVRAERAPNKKLYGQLAFQPLPGLWTELYGDWDPRATTGSNSLLKAFLGYRGPDLQLGAEVLSRQQHHSTVERTSALGLSLLSSVQLWEEPELTLVLRYDQVAQAPDRHLLHHLGLVAVEYVPTPNVRIMPNLWILAHTRRDPQAPRFPIDIVARLSFFVQYL
ncbi:MAG: hypothetical protein NZ960_08425 [Candidatus Kapabacteria bacterium]|nr:hypothetical protein [Candidatus Kapabacteria bacterium]MDW8012007.1 hypothetical protein [Bacteroidota bacterium]